MVLGALMMDFGHQQYVRSGQIGAGENTWCVKCLKLQISEW